MVPLKSVNLFMLALGVGLLISNAAAKTSLREVQVLKALERFKNEADGTSDGQFSITATSYVPPAVYWQIVDVCLVSFHTLQLESSTDL